MRLLYLTFLAETNAYKIMEGAHDAPIAMTLPLLFYLLEVFLLDIVRDMIIEL